MQICESACPGVPRCAFGCIQVCPQVSRCVSWCLSLCVTYLVSSALRSCSTPCTSTSRSSTSCAWGHSTAWFQTSPSRRRSSSPSRPTRTKRCSHTNTCTNKNAGFFLFIKSKVDEVLYVSRNPAAATGYSCRGRVGRLLYKSTLLMTVKGTSLVSCFNQKPFFIFALQSFFFFFVSLWADNSSEDQIQPVCESLPGR